MQIMADVRSQVDGAARRSARLVSGADERQAALVRVLRGLARRGIVYGAADMPSTEDRLAGVEYRVSCLEGRDEEPDDDDEVDFPPDHMGELVQLSFEARKLFRNGASDREILRAFPS
jgi:hypothetical protein